MSQADSERPDPTPVDLVFALCHEIGNLVGAMRLHAHLLDPGMGDLALARTAVDLDDLSARSSALLMQIRPLLRPDPPLTAACDSAALLDELRTQLLAQGGRGAALRVDAVEGLPRMALGASVLLPLVTGFAFKSIEDADGRGTVQIRAERRGDAVALVVEDDAPVVEDPRAWRSQTLRGRPLMYAVASRILEASGGLLEVERHASLTRVALILPAAAPR